MSIHARLADVNDIRILLVLMEGLCRESGYRMDDELSGRAKKLYRRWGFLRTVRVLMSRPLTGERTAL